MGDGAMDEDVDLDALLTGSCSFLPVSRCQPLTMSFIGKYTPRTVSCEVVYNAPAPSFDYSAMPVETYTGPGSLALKFPVPLPGSPFMQLQIRHDVGSMPTGYRVLIIIDGVLRPAPADEEDWWMKLERGAEQVLQRGAGVKVVRWIWTQIQQRRP